MVFKVVIRHPSVDDDEHNYYAVVFPNRDIGQIKQLKFVPPSTLEAKFSFASSKVKPGENFLAVLVPVEESEITGSTCGKLLCKMGTNSEAHEPEVVNSHNENKTGGMLLCLNSPYSKLRNFSYTVTRTQEH